MKIALADIETTGLDTQTVDIHCIAILTDGMTEPALYPPTEIEEGLKHLDRLIDEGYTLAGHNFIEYDLPILRRYGMKDPGVCYDTRTISRAAFPGNKMAEKDAKLWRSRPKLAGAYMKGGHDLKAWGLRLGVHKGDYDGGWEEYSEEMGAYCVKDLVVNKAVLDRLRVEINDEAAMLECEVHHICERMKKHGVVFDVAGAVDFTAELAQRRKELSEELTARFGTWLAPHGKPKTPKRTQSSKKYSPGEEGYMNVREGCDYQNIKEVEFNPASHAHIAHVLQSTYGWKPTHLTDKGNIQVTAEILQDLTYPEAPLLAEYQEIQKILGYVSEGDNGWLKLVRDDGRIHGTTKPTGTVSGRAAHNSPNTGNVPARSKYGKRARQLFTVGRGNVLVGADASGLQLRGLAHYLARWDGRQFATQCETGDIHEFMREATGLFTRDKQKTWTYAKLFGAGARKLGQTAILDHIAALEKGLTDKPVPKASRAAALGRTTLDNLGDAIPAFTELEAQLANAAKVGSLATVDGRRLPVGSAHTAIAMLLQGIEAVIMKRAMVIAAPRIYALGGEFVLWVHDEFQVECLPENADKIGQIMVKAMNEAGEYYNLRVAIDGEYQVGKTWADTH